MTVTIPTRLPSLNDYIRVCRANRYQAAAFKRRVENEISWFIKPLPCFERVRLHFHWIEPNGKRDLDNIAFAKKFILDAMVRCGKLKNDNRKCVIGFTDSFEVGDKAAVIVAIEEIA